jgi:hypothetical protein
MTKQRSIGRLLVLASGLALVLALGAGTAGAQTEDPYVDGEVLNQGEVQNQGGANGAEVLDSAVLNSNVVADPAVKSNALAFTGTEIAVFAVIGSGLVVFGAILLIGSRRRSAAHI